MRFRRILLLFILLLPSFMSGAEDISALRARRVAESFLSRFDTDGTRTAYDLELINYDESASTRSDVLPAYYIFNLPQGGFVIISGIEAAVPVLGYSLEHSFSLDEDMPESLREWLSAYESQILDSRRSGTSATSEQLERWNRPDRSPKGAGTGASVDLKTPDWGQGSPFNRSCPLDSKGKLSLVGCVATAYSQLIYYYKYPESGTGTIPAYTAGGITVPENVLGRAYKYGSMLTKYSGVSYTTAQAAAVSELCFDVADACQATFGSGSTSASTTSSAQKICTYFGYDRGIERRARDYSSADAWKNMLKASIDAKEPVVYFANNATSGAGHAFLVDGYDNEDRFLINFGWNGSSNGYYELDAFGAYTDSQGCLTGVVPDRGGELKYSLVLSYHISDSGTEYKGMTYNSGTVRPGSTASVKLGYIKNVSISDFKGYIRPGIVDKQGNFKCWARDSTSFNLSLSYSSGYTSFSFTIPSGYTVRQGDVLKLFYRSADNPAWYPMACNEDDPRVCGAFPLHIADATSLTYLPETRTLRIYSFSGATYTLKTSSQTRKASGTIYGSKAIDLSSYSSGTYILSVTYGGNTYSVNIVL